jgi:ClpP class serine protease
MYLQMYAIRQEKLTYPLVIRLITRLDLTSHLRKILEATVGVYSEYLDKNLDFESLCAERKNQLKRISVLRSGRDILVYAADLNKSNPAISINYSDVLPFNDQLANLKGKKLDLILETPGGSGEAAEDMVRVLRDKYEDVAVIVP